MASIIGRIKEAFKDEIEEFAKENAIYSPDDYKEANIKEFLKNYELEQIGAGLHARVFRIKNKKWLIKEARWDLDMKMFGDAKLPLPAMIAQKILGIFKFEFVPSKENILDDYKSYLEFSQYFGYFGKKEEYPHPNINLIASAQKNIRETLLFFKPALERKYKIKLNGKIDEILNSDEIKYHNFLPNEYQLVGESISKENKGKLTSYIFQEFCEGNHLSEVEDEKLEENLRKQLIVMIYLILLMHMQIGLIPDTKPRNAMINAYNWLTHTDNIIVGKEGVKFIDTRWFWDVNSNFVKRGLVIPEMIIGRATYSLNALLETFKENDKQSD